MLIPYSTDAPIYHFPRMTIGLIVANVIIFSLTGMGAQTEGWLLTYGRGLRPLEWVSYNFFHFDIVHLLGNMFFLWAFGIVVEGKLGWWKFLALYLAIGIFGGIAIQTVMLGHVSADPGQFDLAPVVEGAAGASLVLYGLMAIVLIWAPRNEIYCAWVGLRSGTFEIEYLYFCGFYIVTEILSAVFSARGLTFSSEIGHTTGVVIGIGLGVLFVKCHWVDCENWDLFSVVSGRHMAAVHANDWQDDHLIRSSRRRNQKESWDANFYDDQASAQPSKKKKKSKPRPKLVELDSFDAPFETIDQEAKLEKVGNLEDLADFSGNDDSVSETASPPWMARSRPHEDPLSRIRKRILDGEYQSALQEFWEERAINPEIELTRDELQRLADGIYKAKQPSSSVPLFEEYIRRFGDDANRQRIKLSLMYVKSLHRPRDAMQVLAKVEVGRLTNDYRTAYEKIKSEAQRLIDAGDGKG